MRRLFLTAAAPALLLAACASDGMDMGAEGSGEPLFGRKHTSADLVAPPQGEEAIAPRVVQPLDMANVPIMPTNAQGRPPHFPIDLSPEGVRAADDHLALEEVKGEEAMAFVAEENRLALETLTQDPRYETYRAEAEAILTNKDRIASPHFQSGRIFNFWQDEANPKGVWRRVSLDSYKSANPAWETVIDVDALSKAEGRDWVWKGTDCLAPDEALCLVNLSDGGRDAVVVREFDTRTRRFVDGGFNLPEGKHRIEWLDKDTLLVATDFGPGTLTESGYPFIVKALKRGQTLAQASEVYRGSQADGGYGVSPIVLRDPAGAVEMVLVSRPLDTFDAEYHVIRDGKTAHALPLPPKATVQGTYKGQLLFTLEQDFFGQKAGALMAWPVADANVGPTARMPSLIVAPTARQSIEGVSATRSGVAVNLYDNVVGGVDIYDIDGSTSGNVSWKKVRSLAVPSNSSVGIVDASDSRDQFFISAQGFLTPSTLILADAATGAVENVKQAPAMFDASTHVVEQFQATSADGTKVPYFVVRPRDLAMDGSGPTILFGYGGFQVSKPPAYIPEMGKLWLERGGVFVNANIRGGGEFGPAWHQSVLKEKRQGAFDDFAAVAQDLIARGVTSPEHLGIYGRSNGGVLTSVAITQHPELYNAAVIESPLIDMLRYHELPAGASWIGEYGDPRIPEEAAYIARYSAYQQLRPDVDYPVAYITTNTLDDRVHPGHARKFAARLGEMGHGRLYYEETSGGHSNDADPVANARRWARHYVYLSQQLMD